MAYADNGGQGAFDVVNKTGERINNTIGNITKNRQAQLDYEKSEYGFNQQKFQDEQNLVNGLYSSPVWESGDPAQISQVLDQVQAQAKARGLGGGKNPMIDQVRARVASGDINGAKQTIRQGIDSQMTQAQRFGLIEPTTQVVNNVPTNITLRPGGSNAGPQINTPTVGAPQGPGGPGNAGGGVGGPAAAGAPLGAAPTKLNDVERANPLGDDISLTHQNQFSLNPGFATDQAAGQAMVKGASQFLGTVPTTQRNLDEAMTTASQLELQRLFKTGKPADIERKWAELTQDPKFQQLNKDLAQIQITSASLNNPQWLESDAGRQMVAIANGTEPGKVLAPEVMKNILGRQAADFEQQKMKSTAIQHFAQNHGAYNVDRLNNAFAKYGSDNRVFELSYWMNSNADPKAKQSAVADIMKGIPEKDRKKLFDNYQKLDNLSRSGNIYGK